jgi:bifunctional DNA-binding transcriptional regulator/antitoxin component of YhaV-PrlF toxin-antitoxin module
MTVILKSTKKGQITVPMSWRKQFNTNQFLATINGDKLEIEPLIINKKKTVEEFTVFDAIRDNRGKGIKAKDLVSILEKLYE